MKLIKRMWWWPRRHDHASNTTAKRHRNECTQYTVASIYASERLAQPSDTSDSSEFRFVQMSDWFFPICVRIAHDMRHSKPPRQRPGLSDDEDRRRDTRTCPADGGVSDDGNWPATATPTLQPKNVSLFRTSSTVSSRSPSTNPRALTSSVSRDWHSTPSRQISASDARSSNGTSKKVLLLQNTL